MTEQDKKDVCANCHHQRRYHKDNGRCSRFFIDYECDCEEFKQ
jgi:hypothetical protein